jgi:hypothetical protein
VTTEWAQPERTAADHLRLFKLITSPGFAKRSNPSRSPVRVAPEKSFFGLKPDVVDARGAR